MPRCGLPSRAARASATVALAGLLGLTGCGGGDGDARTGPVADADASQSTQASDTPSERTTDVPEGCTPGPADDVESTIAIITDPTGCPGSVNTFWQRELGDAWTEPTFIPYDDGDIPGNECGELAGPDEFADNAFYCTLDGTIAYSRDLFEDLYEQGGPYLPVLVLMHELGHRANDVSGNEGVIPRSEENQADCAAGVTTRFARDEGRLPSLPINEVVQSFTLLYQIGDDRPFSDELAEDPGAHGTPEQRVVAFGRGLFQNDYDVCVEIGQSEQGTVGPF